MQALVLPLGRKKRLAVVGGEREGETVEGMLGKAEGSQPARTQGPLVSDSVLAQTQERRGQPPVRTPRASVPE